MWHIGVYLSGFCRESTTNRERLILGNGIMEAIGAGSSDIFRASWLAGNQVCISQSKSTEQASNFESHAGFSGCTLEARIVSLRNPQSTTHRFFN